MDSSKGDSKGRIKGLEDVSFAGDEKKTTTEDKSAKKKNDHTLSPHELILAWEADPKNAVIAPFLASKAQWMRKQMQGFVASMTCVQSDWLDSSPLSRFSEQAYFMHKFREAAPLSGDFWFKFNFRQTTEEGDGVDEDGDPEELDATVVRVMMLPSNCDVEKSSSE